MQTVSVGIGKLSRMNSKALKELKDIILVNDPWGEPIVAVIPYAYYLKMQSLIIQAEVDERFKHL